MRKIVAATFLSLDGVMQAPGGAEEDRTGGFKFGGWIVPYADDVTGAPSGTAPHPTLPPQAGGGLSAGHERRALHPIALT